MTKQIFLYSAFLCLCIIAYFLTAVIAGSAEEQTGKGYVYRDFRPSYKDGAPEWDPNGYVIFCLCMGRVGNQAEHFLGGMAFAKALNRTLILPPWRTYRNIMFTEWFKYEPMADFHKVILAEDFMKYLASTHWPVGKRIGFCYQPPSTDKTDCDMKKGNPFQSFWDGLNIDFDSSEIYHITYTEYDQPKWNEIYPADEYPVIAMRGAPASFPVNMKHWDLQKHLVFSERVVEEAEEYINENFPGEPFVGIHLRNGPDWTNACAHAEGRASYMASPQCMGNSPKSITKNMCLPSVAEVLRLVKNIVMSTKAKVVFVATDKNPMIKDIEEHLQKQNVRVFHADPHLPLTDWAILGMSDHFIANCVSSFSSFVKRARDVKGLPTSFWGYS